MNSRLWVLLFLTAAIAVMLSTSQEATGEADPFVDEVLYSSSSVEENTIILSGRDNGTYYRYLIIDDYEDSPENWSQPGFNDSGWVIGAAPFGDREYNNVDPNTDWDTTGSSPYNDDIILIRHKFQLSGVVNSAEINVAFANYCTPFLNGNLIYSERGGNSHGMEYWNDDGTETIPSTMFNDGENVLAVYGRDYVYGSGNQNRQWLDLQMTAQVFKATNDSIILGDTVLVAINGGNHGNTSANNFTINVTANNTLVEAFYFETVAADSSSSLWMAWTPELVGLNQLDVQISCDCNDTNLSNNLFTMNLTTLTYSLEASFDDGIIVVNGSRMVDFSIEVQNTGDLVDNVSLTPSESMFGNWNIEFTPNDFLLLPGQTQSVTITVLIPDSYNDGFYNLSFDVESQYDNVVTKSLLKRGSTNDVAWRWINSTGSSLLYNNTNWTKLSFNDTSWSDGSTPFGDTDLGGIDYKTFWDGDNYAYFRHIVDIPDMGLYEGGFMSINVATNNYGDHYINGIYVFGDMDEGSGHGAEYWNEEFQVYINYLNQGPNVIASVVSNPTNTQWFDQEIMMTFPQSNLWGYNTVTYDVPIYLDSTAPTSRVNEEGFYRNSSTFEVKWRSLTNSEDLEGYYIYYLVKDGSTLGDWTLLGFFTNNSINFTGENGLTYRFKSISLDTLGNLEKKGTYDTEMRVDMENPKSTLWLAEGDLEFTNLDGVTIKWKPGDNSSDILGYFIEYRIVGDESWEDLGSFTSIGEYWFSPEIEGQYEIRSRTVDFAGNSEDKDSGDVSLTFDRVKPSLTLAAIDSLTGGEDLILAIEYTSENLSQIKLEYARLPEGTEDVLVWDSIDEEWDNGTMEIRNLVDGYTYYFRINPVDLASNENPKHPLEFTLLWNSNMTTIELPAVPLKPVTIGKIRNMELTVDEDLDGVYERTLEEFTGTDLSAMKANQYWVDYDNARVIFGDGTDGYLPPTNSSISIVYHAYDIITTIDTTPAQSVEIIEYLVEDRNNVTITWEKPQDATSFIIENRKNFTTPWIAIDTTESLEYHVTNLSSGYHYYRIISVDRMGYTNSEMEGEMMEIFIEAEIIPSTVDSGSEKIAPELYLAAVVLLAVAASSAFYMLRGREQDLQPEGSVLVPVEVESPSEQISEDADETKNVFSIKAGSEFSKQVIFICEIGCQSEFSGDDDDEEIMCPHCGMIGDTPLTGK